MTKQNILGVMKYVLVIALMLVAVVVFSACNIFGGDDKGKESGGDSQMALLNELNTAISNTMRDGYVLAEYDVDEETQAKTATSLWGFDATKNRWFYENLNLTTEEIENGSLVKYQLEISSKTMYSKKNNKLYKHTLTDEEWSYMTGDDEFDILGFLNCKTTKQVENYINKKWQMTDAKVSVTTGNNEFTVFADDQKSTFEREILLVFNIENGKIIKGEYIFIDGSHFSESVEAEFVLNTTFAEHWEETNGAIEDKTSVIPENH